MTDLVSLGRIPPTRLAHQVLKPPVALTERRSSLAVPSPQVGATANGLPEVQESLKHVRTLHVIVGPCAAGKTTYAHALARRESAVAFVHDEWGARRRRLEGRIL
jgi:hypothetical protein